MTRGVPELTCEWKFSITEGGKKYNLTAKLYKSRLDVEDEEGNKLAIDKRDGAIKIERLHGTIEWHRENR